MLDTMANLVLSAAANKQRPLQSLADRRKMASVQHKLNLLYCRALYTVSWLAHKPHLHLCLNFQVSNFAFCTSRHVLPFHLSEFCNPCISVSRVDALQSRECIPYQQLSSCLLHSWLHNCETYFKQLFILVEKAQIVSIFYVGFWSNL